MKRVSDIDIHMAFIGHHPLANKVTRKYIKTKTDKKKRRINVSKLQEKWR